MPGKVTDDPSLVIHRVPAAGAAPGRAAVASPPAAYAATVVAERTAVGVRRLYTVAMMADVLGVPGAAVRHWVRGALLVPVERRRGIAWFDFSQLVIGRTLARLLAAGLSLREIDAKLGGLAPGGAGDAARRGESIIADGRRLSIRRGGHVLGANGQLQFRFYTDGLHDTPAARVIAAPAAMPEDREVIEIAIDEPPAVADLEALAADLEAAGDFTAAAEALRAALQAGGADARLMFMLAELLYRTGDLTAARERYYAAVELDADHLEARTSLGCVLAELGDHELAIAALEGVLRQQPDYADAHWHMAGVLDGSGRLVEARQHLREFLHLAPESAWATLARQRLDA